MLVQTTEAGTYVVEATTLENVENRLYVAKGIEETLPRQPIYITVASMLKAPVKVPATPPSPLPPPFPPSAHSPHPQKKVATLCKASLNVVPVQTE